MELMTLRRGLLAQMASGWKETTVICDTAITNGAQLKTYLSTICPTITEGAFIMDKTVLYQNPPTSNNQFVQAFIRPDISVAFAIRYRNGSYGSTTLAVEYDVMIDVGTTITIIYK